MARRKATSMEARENQLIALAIDAVEERIRSRTATSQELCHFLKLASSKDRLEKEKLELEKELLAAKAEAIKSQQRVEELYANALSAMRSYSYQSEQEITDEEDVYDDY